MAVTRGLWPIACSFVSFVVELLGLPGATGQQPRANDCNLLPVACGLLPVSFVVELLVSPGANSQEPRASYIIEGELLRTSLLEFSLHDQVFAERQ